MNLQTVYKNFKETGVVPSKSIGNSEISVLIKQLSTMGYETRSLCYVLQLLNLQECKNIYVFLKTQWKKYADKQLQKSTPTINNDNESQFDTLKIDEIVNTYDLDKLKIEFVKDCQKFLVCFQDDTNKDFLYQGILTFFEFFTVTRFEYKQKYYQRIVN